jgi:hypothetical protein
MNKDQKDQKDGVIENINGRVEQGIAIVTGDK